jgi:PadR family transcriptional regulator PadR
MSGHLGDFEQLILLALLRLGDQAYGVAIRREIQDRTDRSISIGALYTTLQRMEGKGLVRSAIGEPTPERGGRRKKYYSLETAGSRALAGSYRAWRGMTRDLESILDAL